MKPIAIACVTGLVAFSALLWGCATNNLPVNGPARATLGPLPKAAVSPQRDLLYATAGDSQIFIYSYPRLKHVFTLQPATGTASECSDRAGNVFVATSDGLLEYRHGGVSPIATIGLESDACSVDPVSGDLAVVQYGYGIRIFRPTKNGWHLPATRTPAFQAASCGYDNRGNLFVDGASGNLELAELPKGAKTFVSISVDQPVYAAGSVQWDGAHLAVTDSEANPTTIYRYSISGSAATLAGTTKLSGSTRAGETWIFKGRVMAAIFSSGHGVGVWKYPAGGPAITTIPIDAAGGVTISI